MNESLREILVEVEATLEWIANRPFTEKERKAAEVLYLKIRRQFGQEGGLSAADKPKPERKPVPSWPPKWDRSPILPEETCTEAMARRVHEWAIKAAARHKKSPIVILEVILAHAIDRRIADDACQVCWGGLESIARVLGVAEQASPQFLESARKHAFGDASDERVTRLFPL